MIKSQLSLRLLGFCVATVVILLASSVIQGSNVQELQEESATTKELCKKSKNMWDFIIIHPLIYARILFYLGRVKGMCEKCNKNELAQDYCKPTGRKVSISCKDGKNYVDDFKSCKYSAEDSQLQVVFFELLMGIIGGVAYYGVQARKKNTMSLFDSRKLR